MKIIEDNFNKDVSHKFKPYEAACENCNSKFLIEKDDLKVGTYGCYIWTCPYCGEKNFVDDSIILTQDNVEFPLHYESYSDGKDISDDEINKWVKRCISNLDKDKDFWMTASGNSFVLAYKSDEEYNEVSVIVCKNYYETCVQIPKERY